MRIIDKNNDFYDYLQDSTDKLVFDRRGSYILTKEDVCSRLDWVRYYRDSIYRFLILQCGAQYWLILATITETDSYHNATNYSLEILDSWKNYNKKRNLLRLDLITFNIMYMLKAGTFNSKELDYSKIKSYTETLKNAIDSNDYTSECTIADSNYTYHDWKSNTNITEFKPPILRATSIGLLIDPLEIFTAIEEHYSLLKTESERTEAIGATNDDKIIMHGFDTKTSFRGK